LFGKRQPIWQISCNEQCFRFRITPQRVSNELINFLYIARGSAGEVRSMLCVMDRTRSFGCLQSEIAKFKQACESISRQLRGWADSLQNSDIQGQKHLNEHSRKQYDARKRTFTRRGLIQLGGASWMGLNLGGLWHAQAAGASGLITKRPIRACILIFYYGGPSHLDTYDLKPNATAEIRGTFKPISTAVPGMQISEHLPRMAKVMDKVALIRSVHHRATLHDSASIHALTGRPLEGPDRELFAPLPQFYPSFGSAFSYFNRNSAREVPFASLPYVFQNVVPTPCQGGGFLGRAYDPLLIDVDPREKTYPVESLRLKDGLGLDRLAERKNLLGSLGGSVHAPSTMSGLYDKAYRLIESKSIRRAIDVTQESLEMRERYGFGEPAVAAGEVNGGGGEMGVAREMRGQNLLMARRLVEAGVPFVNVYDCKQQGQNWDAHVNCESQHKNFLLPLADQSLSALLVDLEHRGLLEETLVVATGEFGRTPRINAQAGRDHWPNCYTVLMAGGGVQGGAIFGSSDRNGEYPATDPVTPGDIAATIFWRFGLNHAAEIHDQTGRPHRLTTGEPIVQLF
jgi:Protein of unknown function (DUF1501)